MFKKTTKKFLNYEHINRLNEHGKRQFYLSDAIPVIPVIDIDAYMKDPFSGGDCDI